jgi:hypothetical protein
MAYYPPVKGQVHRFRDSVALYIGTGETVYVSAADARKIARALNRAAKSCASEPFAQSSGLTFAFSFQDGREKDLPR